MKRSLHTCVMGILCSFLLASCSQSKDLASAEKDHQYRYNKVYVGNKIVYRGLNKEDQSEKQRLAMTGLLPIAEDAESAMAMPIPIPVAKGAKETVEKSGSKRLTNNKSIFRNIGRTFTTNLAEIRGNTFRGTLSKESAGKIKDNISTLTAEDRTAATSADEIFAILGFVFGLAAFIGGVTTLIGAILGVVFSILGWNSDWHIFALLGLIFAVVAAVLVLAEVI